VTGAECYQEALRLIGSAHGFNIEGDSAANARCLAEAQVLATLAVAAATALNDPGGGMTLPDFEAWVNVASDYKRPSGPEVTG
jgi:hypothetical protein